MAGAEPAARKFGEEPTHCGGARVEIRGRRGSRSGMAASVVLLGSRQGCCAANGGLGCGGAARGHGGAVLCSHGAREEAARVCGAAREWIGCRAAAVGANKGQAGDLGDACLAGPRRRSRWFPLSARGGAGGRGRPWRVGPGWQREGGDAALRAG